jgi:hypothetical protein
MPIISEVERARRGRFLHQGGKLAGEVAKLTAALPQVQCILSHGRPEARLWPMLGLEYNQGDVYDTLDLFEAAFGVGTFSSENKLTRQLDWCGGHCVLFGGRFD